ncbi:sulfatase family protein [Nocardioides sp.]|uniref:sulfatase family protein n=1 Tax=Nocardioides sp. TaxID=35761 RepID=UPI003D0E0DC0
MTRFPWRATTAVVVLALVAGALAATGRSGPPARADRATQSGAQPNIVLVLTDDLSRDLVVHMPAVRRLKQAGLSAERYIISNSLCCPSRASLLTGRYSHNTGIFTNEPPDGGFETFHDNGGEESTLATDLQAAGYRTGFLGKYLNGYPVAGGYVPPGWSTWVSTDRGYRGFNYTLNVDGELRRRGDRPVDYLTDVLGRYADRFVSESAKSGQPFFLEISTFAPHTPFVPAPRHARLFPRLKAPRGPAFDVKVSGSPAWLDVPRLTRRDKQMIDRRFRNRVRSVQAIDEMLAKVRTTLREQGVAGDTYVIFTSDNGYHLGQHRLRGGKMTAFDTDVRVPLIVSGPGVPRGASTSAVVQNIDLRPTFDEIAGAAIASEVDGLSLLGLWQGAAVATRDYALIEHDGPVAPGDPDAQPQLAGSLTAYAALRGPWTTYVEYQSGEREFYDLRTDPAQNVNAYASLSSEEVARLHRRLAELAACAGVQCHS